MKVLLKTPILDYEDQPISLPDAKGVERNITYFEVITTGLNSQLQGEPPMTAEKKNAIYQLSMKLYKQKEPNLTPEQMTLIKEQVSKAYGPLIVGRVADLLDGVEQPKAETEASTEAKVENSPAN